MQLPKSKKYWFLSVVIIILILFYCYTHYAKIDLRPALKNVSQNAFVYLNPTTENQLLISANNQKQFVENYYEHYFLPWNPQLFTLKDQQGNPIYDSQALINLEQQYIHANIDQLGWGADQHLHSKEWGSNILTNMNMAEFPSLKQKAIIVVTTNLRTLPTDDPSYDDWNEPGQGYPFDNLQESLITANTPVLILHTSKDGAWDFVLSQNDVGWVHHETLAFINDDLFIKQWYSLQYIAISHDKTPIYDVQHRFRMMARVGMIFPLVKDQKNNYLIKIAISNTNQNAVIQFAEINKKNAVIMPLTVTAKNIAMIANQLLGESYGWGGSYQYRDCSATMQDLFTPFGIWLPRNSVDQSHAGVIFDLSNMNIKQKLQLIQSKGIPFLTLLHLPGHIVLYIGEYQNNAYILQDVWGLHTWRILGPSGRSVIGQTVITPLDLGKNYINVPRSFIAEVDSMTLLTVPANPISAM